MTQVKEPVEDYRNLESMSSPDSRWSLFKIFDAEAETFRPVTLEDQYRQINQFNLSNEVPESIRIQWDTARNLWLYSWHVWRFQESAEMRAYSTLEMALRLHLGIQSKRKSKGLKDLMLKAIHDGLLKDYAIEHYRRISKPHNELSPRINDEIENPTEIDCTLEKSQEYCRILADSFPKLRNGYAHGSESCGNPPALTFSLCRDLINQLWSHAGSEASS